MLLLLCITGLPCCNLCKRFNFIHCLLIRVISKGSKQAHLRAGGPMSRSRGATAVKVSIAAVCALALRALPTAAVRVRRNTSALTTPVPTLLDWECCQISRPPFHMPSKPSGCPLRMTSKLFQVIWQAAKM